jgi:hypothetical protein
MYRFEIRAEESRDNVTRYCWELVFSAGGGEEEVVVATGRPAGSLAEAESGVRAFRRGVARAEVTRDREAGSGDSRLADGVFRPVPHVVSLNAAMRGRYDSRDPGCHHPVRPADTGASAPDREGAGGQEGPGSRPGQPGPGGQPGRAAQRGQRGESGQSGQSGQGSRRGQRGRPARASSATRENTAEAT